MAHKETMKAPLFTLLLAVAVLLTAPVVRSAEPDRPNILFAISDDQSFPHASAYGCEFVHTPAFDRIAGKGVLFMNAFAPSPGCSPSRAAMLTGRFPWMIENAGTHASEFPAKYVTYPDLLEQGGYFVGYTGKGWGPGNWKESGRTRNPAGPEFSKLKLPKGTTPEGISSNDYSGNFKAFLEQRPAGKPFFFWYGATEPHRSYKKGIGLEQGKKLEDVTVPEFLPDTLEVRSDLLDYAVEIEWFDSHLGRMLDLLEANGELDNTLVVITSDNGMPFPRAKANCYEYGIHLPLAVSWPAKVPGGRVVKDVVSLAEFCPTFLEVAGVEHPGGDYPLATASLLPVLESEKDGQVDPARLYTYSSRERHSSSRWNNLAYPQRALRTEQYLFIRNFKPERWPAGAPQKMGEGNYPKDVTQLGPMHGGYHDIDACPTLDFLVENRDDEKIGRYLGMAVAKRPAVEMYDIKNDPACLANLASDPEHAGVREALERQLNLYLEETNDARVTAPDGGDIWETYMRYSKIRTFPKPDWAE